MQTYPYGVQQIFTTTGSAGITEQLIPVTPPNWKKFCLQSDAKRIMAAMAIAAPGSQLAIVESLLEEELMYQFTYTDVTVSPRVWLVNGTLADGSVVSEYAGWLIDRAVKPQPFVDNTSGDATKNTLQVLEEYGYAQFFYGAPAN